MLWRYQSDLVSNCNLFSQNNSGQPSSKERPVNYGRFLMAVLQVTVTCFVGETRAQATRCVRVDGELQVVCLHGHGCTL